MKSLLGLVNASIKSPTIQDWYNDFLDYLEELRQKQENGEPLDGDGGIGEGIGGGDMGGGDEGGGLSDLGKPDFTAEDFGGDEGGGSPEIERFEPQTE